MLIKSLLGGAKKCGKFKRFSKMHILVIKIEILFINLILKLKSIYSNYSSIKSFDYLDYASELKREVKS